MGVIHPPSCYSIKKVLTEKALRLGEILRTFGTTELDEKFEIRLKVKISQKIHEKGKRNFEIIKRFSDSSTFSYVSSFLLSKTTVFLFA